MALAARRAARGRRRGRRWGGRRRGGRRGGRRGRRPPLRAPPRLPAPPPPVECFLLLLDLRVQLLALLRRLRELAGLRLAQLRLEIRDMLLALGDLRAQLILLLLQLTHLRTQHRALRREEQIRREADVDVELRVI